MNASSPAYQYGRFLGEMKNAMEQFTRDVISGFEAARRVTSQMASDPEKVAEFKYAYRIGEERRHGLRYVDSLTDGLARRWGLDPSIKNRKV